MLRDQFECQNQGSYELLYPCHNKPDKMEEYGMLLKTSQSIYLKQEN